MVDRNWITIGIEKKYDMSRLLDEFHERNQHIRKERIIKSLFPMLKRWKRERKRFTDTSDFDREARIATIRRGSSRDAAEEMARIFDNERINYVVIGSFASQLHGAPIFCDDIDVLVPGEVYKNAMVALKAELDELSPGRYEFNDIKIELIFQGALDLEIDLDESITIDNIKVMNIYQTLVSLINRSPRRGKEKAAFRKLIQAKGHELNDDQRQEIITKLGEGIPAITFQSWGDLTKNPLI